MANKNVIKLLNYPKNSLLGTCYFGLHIYLLTKVVCFVCCVKIFETTAPPIVLLVQLEALNEQVQQGYYIMFKPMVQELLKIEQNQN